MTSVLLASHAGEGTLRPPETIPLRLDERWRLRPPPGRLATPMMLAVFAGSLAVHALLVATAFVGGRAPVPAAPREISVEVVQEPQPLPKPKPTPPKPLQKAVVPAPTPPAAPPKPPVAPPKPPAPPPEQAKAEPPKVQPPKVQPEPPRPAPPKPAAAPAPADPAQASEAEALRKELDTLRAEQAALRAAAAGAPPPSTGGPLAGSRQAIALPSIGSGDGEAYGYQDLVFSQLAKAKGLDGYEGRSGTTGVRFELDEAGNLLSVKVVASSGDPALDARALDIIRRAAPFPAPPKGTDRTFVANVNFVPPKP